jgi:hypothetical protein
MKTKIKNFLKNFSKEILKTTVIFMFAIFISGIVFSYYGNQYYHYGVYDDFSVKKNEILSSDLWNSLVSKISEISKGFDKLENIYIDGKIADRKINSKYIYTDRYKNFTFDDIKKTDSSIKVIYIRGRKSGSLYGKNNANCAVTFLPGEKGRKNFSCNNLTTDECRNKLMCNGYVNYTAATKISGQIFCQGCGYYGAVDVSFKEIF